jgi:hypothetical protein
VVCQWLTVAKVNLNLWTSESLRVANTAKYSSISSIEDSRRHARGIASWAGIVIGCINVPIWKGGSRHVLLIVGPIPRSDTSCNGFHHIFVMSPMKRSKWVPCTRTKERAECYLCYGLILDVLKLAFLELF